MLFWSVVFRIATFDKTKTMPPVEALFGDQFFTLDTREVTVSPSLYSGMIILLFLYY